MKLELGKKYITRDGSIARIIAVDCVDHSGCPIVALVRSPGCLTESLYCYRNDGYCGFNLSDDMNLVAEYVERPIVNWSVMPKWAKWVRQQEDAAWYCFTEEPKRNVVFWFDRIPPEYAPKFSGHWKDSLVQRPEGI